MTRSAAVNETAEAAKQIVCALPEPCSVDFSRGTLDLDVPDAEPLMTAKARATLDYAKLSKWIAHNGEVYITAPEGEELKRYLKAHKAAPPVVPPDEVGDVLGIVNGAKLRQSTTLVRACADAARPGQLPMDDRRLAVMIEAAGGYDSPVASAARRLCGIDGPEDDTDGQPDPLDCSR